MESVLGRYKNLIWLVVVLFLQVLGLAVQVKRGTDGQDTRLIRLWAVGAVSPFERALVWAQNSTTNIWHNYFYLRGVRAENRQLKEQIEQMRLEQVRLTEDAAQAHRLQALLAFKEQFVAKTVAAQVIGTSGSDLSRIVTIDKGERAGIRPDMAVITADGIVGKVLVAYPNLAQVLLINDQTSGVGVILGDSRLQGVLAGTANGEVTLNGVMSDEQVPVGEKVLTSGGDQIFPKGLPVGTVAKVGPGKDLFLGVTIKPSADLSRLEEVLVLVEKQERQVVADEKVRVRAADILAQRLPSVPPKPPADATAGGTTAPGSAKPATPAGANSAAKPNIGLGTSAAGIASTSGTVKNPPANPDLRRPLTPQTPIKPVGQAPVQHKPAATETNQTESKPEPAASQPANADQKPATPPSQPAPTNQKPSTPPSQTTPTNQKPATPPSVPPNTQPPDPNSPQ